ncbi:[NiFe]-hydrogenase III apoprotein small subunit [Humitalea rosea]|uniref:[NiFe]-hydrogenase III apoprotein small subunit n=1 Tax=Humitalea rosea TaxID=990373 RepID=A0A2W7I2D4_9PROT|nr:NADH-quinone oxidoreductase subunit NuoB [Humitalea rosea]PZW41091.1 [NiFe]-hydrogenase III apoprotein small subunit [Humitalea rosea]
MLWPRLARSLLSRPIAESVAPPPDGTVAALVARLEAAAGTRLGRSLSIRHVDAGSCNGCELEVHATSNLLHDLERFGLRFVASPRHADVLLVTGPTTRNMAEALAIAYAATPDPKWVVAAGDCAVDGGVFKGSPAVAGGTDAVVPVDLLIPGCPPSPMALIEGLLALLAANAPEPKKGPAGQAGGP